MEGNYTSSRVTERLVLIGTPKIHNGVIKTGPRAGQEYSLLKINAYKRNYLLNDDGTVKQRLSPSYYKLNIFGNSEGNETLSLLLSEKMRVNVCGKATEHQYMAANGQSQTINQIQVDTLALDFIQPGLGKVHIKTEDLDQRDLSEPFSGDYSPLNENSNTISFNNKKIIVSSVFTGNSYLSKEGKNHGKACNLLHINGCDTSKPPNYYKLDFEMPSANALLIASRIEKGMAIIVAGSGKEQESVRGNSADPKCYKCEINYIGIDLKQKCISSIDFEVNPKIYGRPDNFKGDINDYYYKQKNSNKSTVIKGAER